MKKKFVTLVLALMLCIGVVPTMTACGKKYDISVFFMANSEENRFYKAHFEAVAKEKGFSIGYEGQASANYYDLLDGKINASKVPDILYIRPSNIRKFIKTGVIADISKELEAYSEKIDKIYGGAQDLYKYNAKTGKWGEGGTYAVPKDLSVQQLGYNKDLINANRQLIYDYYNAPAHADEKAAMPKNTSGENSGQVKMPWEMDWTVENYTWSQYKRMAVELAKGDTNGPSQSGGDPISGCDYPNHELVMWSFGGTLISEDMKKVNVDSQAFQRASKYMAALLDDGAVKFRGNTFVNFTGTKDLCFYSQVNSFDIGSFDKTLGKDHWDIMPWPVADPTGEFSRVDGTVAEPTDWQGVITSAGFAVSKACKNKARAVEVIMSLLEDDVQEALLAEEKVQLPLFEELEEGYLTDDVLYSPKSRKLYIDVITGKNGRISDVYKCYEDTWHVEITSRLLSYVYQADTTKKSAAQEFTDHYTKSFRDTIQEKYEKYRDRK